MGLPERFMGTLTATERRIVEALDPGGRTVPYTAVLAAVWPDRRHSTPPKYMETQRIRAHRTRLLPKLAAVGWQIVTQEGYGIALCPIDAASAVAAVPDPPSEGPALVQLGAREARWALRLAAFMAQRGETAAVRGESRRVEGALRLALDGYESARRRRQREQNARWKAAHPDEWRAHQAAGSARYRERQQQRAS